MKITRVFLDVHLGAAHIGLTELARKAKTKIDADSTVIFINKAQTAFKMFRGDSYLIYFKQKKKTRIPLDAIKYLPTFFGGDPIEFDVAIKKLLEEKLYHEKI